jgi:hypothetical protein
LKLELSEGVRLERTHENRKLQPAITHARDVLVDRPIV